MAGSHSIPMLFSVYDAVLVTLLIQVMYCAPCDYKASKLIPYYRFGSLYERESLPHHEKPFQKPPPPAFGIQGFPDTRFTNLSTTSSDSSPYFTSNTTQSNTSTSESAVPKLASTTGRIMIDEKILAQIFGDDDEEDVDVPYTTEDNSSIMNSNNATEYSKDDRFGNAALDATITLIGG